ncbi:hypothetical protein J4734_25780 [Klebsiella pneumoniae]|uniref:Tetratricopeptide repeat protein n=1 Tax=Klebsiella pneumoniae TaxID=573 RepID=A0A939NUR9_KLEPN|nr:hypothetical protein [Klebsiella pneumoniae]
MSDFEKQTMLRQVRSIPSRYQSLALEGMIHFLDGKNRLGTESLERSLELCPSDDVTWTNYAAILNQKGLYTQAEGLFQRLFYNACPECLNKHCYLGPLGDMEMMTKALTMIEKYDCEITFGESALNTFKNMKNFDEKLRQDIKNAASVVRNIAEEFGLVCTRSHVEDDGFGELAFTCDLRR